MPKHIPWLDAARIIAIFGVILIHVCAPVFGDNRSNFYTMQIANAFDSVSRVSVPLFALISGTLVLQKEPSFVSIKNRIFRVAIPLLFWSFIYVLYVNYWNAFPFDFIKSMVSIFQTPAMYHLWFVYMIIGIYILLPILHPISEKLLANRKLAYYFFTLWFLVNSLTIYFPFDFIRLIGLNDFMSWSGYFMLGHYLVYTKHIPKVSNKILLIVFLMASSFTFGLTLYFNTNFNPLNETAYIYFSPNVMIATIAAFLWLKQINLSNFYVKIASYLSPLVFPVYFMHLLIIAIFSSGILGFSLDQFFIHPFIGILLLSITVFIVSFIVAAIASKIPFISKLIG
ncbi:MAG TPA: acyltransferase family protein [Sulfurovum sp.]|nr:acyltransferase family protein [Sulfurovum sp.]HQS77769.1 acyltransferase family protein [Sulfurovum sp.]HQT28957.1 acyltransferase family protein [Sulfurovum sp.]